MNPALRVFGIAVLLGLAVAAGGCKKARPIERPDYARELPAGADALRKITDPRDLPDLRAAFVSRDAGLWEALDRSLGWFAKPSSAQGYPRSGITRDLARDSAAAFRQLLTTAATPDDFQRQVYRRFDAYQSVGWNGEGEVFFTGYYSPIFRASRARTPEFAYPLYRRPADLVSDPATGKTLGRRTAAGVQPFPTRRQIEEANLLAGQELVWLREALDAFIVQVNGSAKLEMTDGSVMYVGYAGNNGYDYTSIGKLLVRDARIDRNRLSLPVLRQYFRDHPDQLDAYTRQNDRFIFFQEYPGDAWPAGSLGFRVTPTRTLATDKDLFPRASVVLVQTTVPTPAGDGRPLSQFLLDQDAGGAIRAPGRADLYMGTGPGAEALAGRQAATGRLYYFFLKPEAAGPAGGEAPR